MNGLTEACEDEHIPRAISTGFLQAFDRAPHAILLHNTKTRDLGPSPDLLLSFLTNRGFIVELGDVKFKPQISCRAQNNLLHGPMLLLVYTSNSPI